MKFLAAAALASTVLAAPLEKRQAAITDADILQYALTLEHLENVFYKEALSKFTEQDFLDAGYTAEYFSNLKYIAHDEEAHVLALTAGLTAAGAQPVAACEYKFPYTDPKSFVTLSTVLEGVGTSAYLGGAGLIQSKEYLTTAGAILVSEALHTSLQRYTQKLVAPATYGTPLGVNSVFSLAAPFIVSCPDSNAALPVKAYPALTNVQGVPTAQGIPFQFQSPDAAPSGTFFATWISGLTVVSVPATFDGTWISTTVPEGVEGQSYVLLTNANTTSVTDEQVIAGPAIVEVSLDAPTYDNSIRK